MDIQVYITKLLKVLSDSQEPVTRKALSHRLAEVTDESENFWMVMTEKAVHEGFAKTKPQRSKTIAVTPQGEEFLTNPKVVDVQIEGADENDEIALKISAVLSQRHGGGDLSKVSSEHTRMQIKIIKAIDRKIALDEFAEQEHIALDDVLDELDAMLQSGHRFDIRYFVDEVIEPQDTQEIIDFFNECGDDMQLCMEEWGDVYKPQELRLIHYLWKTL